MKSQAQDRARHGTDLGLDFGEKGADLVLHNGDLRTLEGGDNLRQAALLRLLIERGELAVLSHPRFGSRVHELIGEPLDRPNLDLLRRHVRRALLSDPRIAEVQQLRVTPRTREVGDLGVALDVRALLLAVDGAALTVEVALDGD